MNKLAKPLFCIYFRPHLGLGMRTLTQGARQSNSTNPNTWVGCEMRKLFDEVCGG